MMFTDKMLLVINEIEIEKFKVTIHVGHRKEFIHTNGFENGMNIASAINEQMMRVKLQNQKDDTCK